MKLKKFSKLIPFFIFALLVLSLSGCNGHSHSSSSSSSFNSNNNSTNNGTGTETDTETETEVVDTTNANVGISQGTDGVYKLVLSTGAASDASVNEATNTLKVNNFVWHVSPDYAGADSDNPGEYWTNGTTSFDSEAKVQAALTTSQDGIYIARDIRYVPSYLEFSSRTVNKEQSGEDKCYVSYYSQSAVGTANKYILAALPADNNNLATVKASMTHSPSDAYNYPVLHITKPGSYDLSGTWQGQIWVDVDDDEDPKSQVVLILNGLTVNCKVAPALVFKKVYECGSGDIVSSSDKLPSIMASDAFKVADYLADNSNFYAGAIVMLAANKTNKLNGTNVPRLNQPVINKDYKNTTNSADLIGTFVKAQKKMYKLDGAFHSRMSMVITNETAGTNGTLVVSSDYEGLGSELHMLIESGDVTVNAADCAGGKIFPIFDAASFTADDAEFSVEEPDAFLNRNRRARDCIVSSGNVGSLAASYRN